MALANADLDHARETIRERWGENVLTVIDRQEKKPMNNAQFLKYCTACGGNWGGMLLTGINELWPEVWEAIPDDMGVFCFSTICMTMQLLGVDTSEA